MSPPTQTVEDSGRLPPGDSQAMFECLNNAVRNAAPGLKEVIRWGKPCYMGRNLVCSISIFTGHVSFTFWRGALVKDPTGMLVHGQGLTEMRTAKFTSPDQIDPKVVESWVKQAVKLDAESAPARAPRKEVKVVVPRSLAAALRNSAKARTAFDSLSPSCKREYCQWISEAKQQVTVDRRIEATIAKLERGEGLHDKYRK